MNLPVSHGPQKLPGVIWLPAAVTMTSGDLLRLTGWSRQVLYAYRQRHGFPQTSLIDGKQQLRTRDVAAWLVRHGTKVEWL
ncbi:hypothetical protein [Aquamicrobium defluvii]|uniref:hypothetical protein n=1 Tax=Aquamicrobium defluvii TaxID=69279 RepID=UPI001062115E|nr:hypothetical protein [Aquamicrobium defluvii]